MTHQQADALANELKDCWMQVFKGGKFYPWNMSPDDIDIEDIAHSLSMQCRYTGHCINYYSVAEHCCHLFDVATDEDKKWALLHDATEAYLSDIPRPIKPLLPEYVKWEHELMKVIAKKYNLEGDKEPPSVKILDTRILKDEYEQNMVKAEPWYLPFEPLGVNLQFWTPERAEYEFLARWVFLHG